MFASETPTLCSLFTSILIGLFLLVVTLFQDPILEILIPFLLKIIKLVTLLAVFSWTCEEL